MHFSWVTCPGSPVLGHLSCNDVFLQLLSEHPFLHLLHNFYENSPKTIPKEVSLLRKNGPHFGQIPSKWPNLAPRCAQVTTMEFEEAKIVSKDT